MQTAGEQSAATQLLDPREAAIAIVQTPSYAYMTISKIQGTRKPAMTLRCNSTGVSHNNEHPVSATDDSRKTAVQSLPLDLLTARGNYSSFEYRVDT